MNRDYFYLSPCHPFHLWEPLPGQIKVEVFGRSIEVEVIG
jgi:hypothetical protein